MALERTLSIVKPDGVARNLIGEVYRRFENAGLRVVAARMAASVAGARPRASMPCIANVRSSRTWSRT